MHWQTRTHQTESEKNQDLSGFEPQTCRFPGKDSTTIATQVHMVDSEQTPHINIVY